MVKSIYNYFNESVSKYPDNTAILVEGERTSYSELKHRVDDIANRLVLFVGDNDTTVSILLHRSVDLIAYLLAVNMLGLSYVPIDPLMPGDRIKYILEDSRTTIAITDYEYIPLFLNLRVLCPSDIACNSGAGVIDVYGETAYKIYTSGSTGQPKGVMITTAAVNNFFKGIDLSIDFSGCSRILCLTTVAFDIFVLEALYSLYLGITVILSPDGIASNPSKVISLMKDYEADAIQITPSRLRMICEYDSQLHCLQNVKLIMIGGEGFPYDLLLLLQKYTTARIYNMYGPTEATVWCFVAELTKSERIHIGQPLQNVTYKIMCQDNVDNEQEQGGELYIGGACLAEGYVNNPVLTGEKFICVDDSEGVYYKSGDYCIENTYGEIECLGRLDNQLKIRGYRVEPEEIEHIICGYSRDIQCVCLPEADNNNYLICYYVSDNEINKQDVVQYLSHKLPQYMVPYDFIRVSKLSYMISGKLDRAFLKTGIQQFIIKTNSGIAKDQSGYSRELTRLLTVFTTINKKYSGITADATLMEVGLDSIDFISLVVKLEEEFNIQFADDKLDINLFPDVLSLLDYIKSLANSK